MRCYWCNIQAQNKVIPVEEAKVVGLPYFVLTIRGASTEGSMYFHKRECLADWLNTEEGKKI